MPDREVRAPVSFRRTYSGVCAVGQAAGSVVLTRGRGGARRAPDRPRFETMLRTRGGRDFEKQRPNKTIGWDDIRENVVRRERGRYAYGGMVMDVSGLEILVPALLGCAMVWWMGQAMSWAVRFAVSAIMVVFIIAVLRLGQVGL